MQVAGSSRLFFLFFIPCQPISFAGYNFAIYIGDPDGEFDLDSPTAVITGFSNDTVASPAGKFVELFLGFNSVQLVSQEKRGGGERSSLSPVGHGISLQWELCVCV